MKEFNMMKRLNFCNLATSDNLWNPTCLGPIIVFTIIKNAKSCVEIFSMYIVVVRQGENICLQFYSLPYFSMI